MTSKLEDLRQRLTDVDREILESVAERQRLVDAIGRSKLEQDLGTRDFARERRVIENARNQADRLGLDRDLVDGLMRRLIEGSLARQESDRVRATGKGADRSALVLGGLGKMGRWFADFMASQGYTVHIADPTAGESPHPRIDDWEACLDAQDVVVVAAPIEASARLLERLASLRPPGLVFDIASLKSPLRAGLRALADSGCTVCSVHPMFGPDTRLLSGRHVILVDLGHDDAVTRARELFAGTMAELVEMSLEDHDRLVAYVLGLSHVLNIAFFTALRESGEAASRLNELSSTTFDAQVQVAQKVAAENPRLYFEIQTLNDYRLAPLNALGDALGRLRRLIESGDESGFVRLMEHGREYLEQRSSSRSR